MNCYEALKAGILQSLEHCQYDNAIFLAERLVVEVHSEESTYLLADCYYRTQQYQRVVWLLTSHSCKNPLSRYLLALCHFHLEEYSKAEYALSNGQSFLECPTVEEVKHHFASHAGYVLSLLGDICRETMRMTKAIEYYRASLVCNPFIWTSFESLCQLDVDLDPSDFFQSASKENLPNNHQTPITSTEVCGKESTPAGVAFDEHHMGTPRSSIVTPTNASVLSSKDLTYVDRTQLKVGRNLLGAPSINSMTSSFGVHPIETSVNDSHKFATPSPVIASQARVQSEPRAPRKGAYDNTIYLQNVTPDPSNIMTVCEGQQLQTMNVITSSFIETPSPTCDKNGNVNCSTSTRPFLRRSTRITNASTKFVHKAKGVMKTKCKLTGPSTPKKFKVIRTKNLGDGRNPVIHSASDKVAQLGKKRHRHGTLAAGYNSDSIDHLMTLLCNIAESYVALCSFKCKKSIRLFNSLPYNHYNTSWILCHVGKALYECCQYQQSAVVFADARRLDPYKIEQMDTYSTVLWHLDKESDLTYLTHELTDISRHKPQTWCAAGNCFSLQKEHDDAIKFFQRAIQVDPKYSYSYSLLGHEYNLIGELEKALKLFKDAVNVDSRFYHGWYGLGMIYLQQEKFEWAELQFKQALAINPSCSSVLCYIGMAQHAQNRPMEAIETLEQAIKLDPNSYLCQYHYSAMLYAKGDYDEALSGLEKLKKTATTESLLYYMIGKIYEKLGQPDLAFMNYSEASHLDPKGQSNGIKEEINRRYLNERNENGTSDNGIGILDAVLEQAADSPDTNSFESDRED